jgi:hypothetical protein
MYVGLHIKYPLFLSDFSESLIFSDYSSPPKKKISREDTNLEPSHSQLTDMMQVKVAFHNFTDAPKYWTNFD